MYKLTTPQLLLKITVFKLWEGLSKKGAEYFFR